MTTERAWGDWGPWLGARASELKASLEFATRLPLARAAPVGGSALAPAVWALPLAGAVVGIIGAAVYALAHRLGVPPWPAAALAVAATLAVTGGLHEDGLADTADGLGGGADVEQKLAIMRDSRIGTYGVCALALSILLRTGAVASLGDAGAVAWALVAAHAAARAAMPLLMHAVAPARADGLSFEAGQPPLGRVAIGAAIGFVILVLAFGLAAAVVATILLLIAVAVIAWLGLAQIGGQTGDIIGALEQVSEIVVLLVAVA